MTRPYVTPDYDEVFNSSTHSACATQLAADGIAYRGLLPDVTDFRWCTDAGQPVETARLGALLSTANLANGDQAAAWGLAKSRILEWTNEVYKRPDGSDMTSLSELPSPYLYALVYINQAMRESVGPSLRFPCNPDDNADPLNGAGCLMCRFMNPQNGSWADSNCIDPDGATVTCTPTLDRFVIECRYRPAGFFIDQLLAMFRNLGMNMPGVRDVSRRLVFSVPVGLPQE